MKRRSVKRLAALAGGLLATIAVREVPALVGMESELAEGLSQLLIVGGLALLGLESRAPKDEAE